MREVSVEVLVAAAMFAAGFVVGNRDVKFVNTELESIRNGLAAADIRFNTDRSVIWIPTRCMDCEGKGTCDGIPCQFCQHKGCPVCRNTGTRSGVCPICQGQGTLYLEKRLK